MEDQNKLAEKIEEGLRRDGILRQVVIDEDLERKFNSTSQEAAVKELESRLFVKVGTADTMNGTAPAIHVGVNGTGREKEVLGDTAQRIIRDVWRMIGIDPDTGKALEQPVQTPGDNF